MFDAAECMFLYVESSLRVGAERGRPRDRPPLQREAATGYPCCPASSLKGVLRARARSQQAPIELLGLLGSPAGERRSAATPSSVVVSDVDPPALPGAVADRPVRLGHEPRDPGSLPARPGGVRREGRRRRSCRPSTPRRRAWPPRRRCFAANRRSSSRSSAFPVQAAEEVGAWAPGWRSTPFPTTRSSTSGGSGRRAAWSVLPEGAYRYFLTHGTQVVPRIRIDPRTGTAADGSLWTEEFLPPETLVYALVGANLPETPPRNQEGSRT